MTRRTGRRILIGLSLAVATMLLAVWVLVRTVWFREWLRDQVTSSVNASINGNLTIDAVTGSLFTDVTLHGVVLRESGAPVLTVERIDAWYNPLDMITGSIRIDRLRVTRPVARVVRDARGWNVARIADADPAAEEPESTLVVAIASAVIDEGTLHLVIDGEPAADVSRIALEAALAVDAAGTLVDVDRLALFDERSGTPLELRGTTVRLTDEGTSIDDLQVLAPGLELSGEATLPAGTEPTELTARLGLDEWTPARYAVYLPGQVADLPPVSGELAVDGALDALGVRWQLAMGEAASSAELTVDATADRPAIAGRLSVADLDPAIVTANPEFRGRVTADTSLDLVIDPEDLTHSQGTMTLEAGPLSVSGYRVDRLAADLALDQGRLQATAHVGAYGATTRARVTVDQPLDATTRRIEATGRIDGLDVAALPEATGRPDLPTSISGGYTTQLAGEAWEVTFRGDESSIGGATIADGATVTARGQGAAIRAELGADVRDVSADLIGDAAGADARLAGRIDAAVTIPDAGAADMLDTLAGSVQASLVDSVVYGQGLSSARVDAAISDGVVTVAALDVQGAGMTADASGTVVLGAAATSTSDLDFSISVPDLAALPESLTQVAGLRGGALVEGTLTGPAERPAVRGEIHLSTPGYQDTASALALNAGFDAALPDRDLEQLSVRFDVGSTFLTVAGQDVEQIQMSGTYEQQRVDLTARIDQEARSFEIDGGLAILPEYREIVLRQLAIAGPGEPWRLDAGPEGITIDYGTDAVRIEPLALVRGTERIAVAGTLGTGEGAASDLSLEVSRVDVADLLTLATGAAIVRGTADGTVELTGTLAAPVVDASLSVTDGAVADVPFGVARADVALADRVATVDGRVEELHGAALAIAGTVPVGDAATAPLDVRVTSDTISLGLLASFTTHLSEIEGTAALDVRAQGTLADPRLDGSVRLADGAFTVVPTGVRYTDVDLDVRLDGDAVFVDRASITDEAGQALRMSGEGTLLGDAAARTVAIDVQGQEFRVLGNELGEVELTVDARVEGRLESPSIIGRIAVDRGRIEVDELLPLVTAEPPTVTPAPADATPPGAAAAIEATPAEPVPADEAVVAPTGDTSVADSVIDVELVMPDNVVLRGDNIRTSAGSLGLGNMNMTIGGNVALRKGPDAPLRLVGAVGVVRGFYEFQGRRFDIQEGSAIQFRGGDAIDPSLDVVGTREISGVTARVEVTGTAREPQLNLSSSPPLDQGDVLSLIVFNQPVSQLGQSQQGDLLDRAGSMALGALATSLADSLGQAFDVDLFEIRAPSADGSGDVTVGTQVSERLFVGFRQEFGSAGASRLSFEYRFTEFLRLLTSVSQGGGRARSARDREAAGADLVFRLRY